MSLAKYEADGDVAVISLASPPVNALKHALRRRIAEGIDKAMADKAIIAVVLIGSERAFSAGADITEMGTPAALAEPVLPNLIIKMEQYSKPIIAAIGGLAMGGGLELAMGAHHRIALGNARLALPEVKLGILPGAGGTQRFPRAVGLKGAVDFILRGDPVAAETFDGTALIARTVKDDLRGEAVAFAREVAASDTALTRLRDLDVDDTDAGEALAAARSQADAKAHHTPALARILDCLEAARSLPIDEGLKFERARFLELRETPAHRGLRHAFLAERECWKIPDVPASTPVRNVDSAAVIGGGTMGRGIAMNFLNAGIPVTLLETGREALDAAVAGIESLYKARVDRGRLTKAVLDKCMGLLTTTLDYDDLRHADFIVEAVFEEMKVKQEVFARLDEIAKQGTVLASNTSTLDVNQIASATTRPQDVVGTHFFSPANVMKLCEIVRGDKTSKEVLATTMAVAKRIGKTAVVAGVCDGFIGNRMLEHYVRMAQMMLEEGALPWQIDHAMEEWGMVMGPFRVGDLAGNDIGWGIRKRRYIEKPHVIYTRIADRLCELGRFGQKTGKGWYLYEKGSRTPIPDPDTEAMIAEYRAEHGITPRKVDDQEIVERCIYAMINECARILQEGIAMRASDIDAIYLTGYGFPRFRGGPMRYADEVGLANVAARMEEFERASGDPFWKPAAMITDLIDSGGTFTR